MAYRGQTLSVVGSTLRQAVMPMTAARRSLVASVRTYDARRFRADLLAGLTVAMVAVPQSMAFARIAEVPAIYGLYTAVFAAVVGALITSSTQLNHGPTNTMSLLTAAAVAAVPGDVAVKVQTAIALALIAGLIQIAFAVGRLGELVRYVSHSVIVGFSAGAGVLIAVGQVPAFLGIDLSDVHSGLVGVPGKAVEMWRGFDGIAWRPVLVGTVSLLAAVACRRVSKLLPAYLIAVVIGALIVFLAGWTPDELRLVGEVPSGLPLPSLPTGLGHWEDLLGPALAIAIVASIEVNGIGKTLAGPRGERIDSNQEFLAIGLANACAAFFQCIPSSGSYSRSALNSIAGAATRFASLFSGLLVAGIFLLLAPAARYIPMASIAAILFIIAWGLIDLAFFRRLIKSNKADLVVCAGTFLATLTISLQYAVFLGIFLNLALYLRRASDLCMTEMVRAPGDSDGFIERPIREDPEGKDVMFLQVEGNLFFAAADDLRDRFNDLLARDVKVVILRLKRSHMVDATIMYVIELFAKQLHDAGRHLVLCGVRPRMFDRMTEFGLTDALGRDNVFVSDDTPFSSAKQAVLRARELVGDVDPASLQPRDIATAVSGEASGGDAKRQAIE